MAIKIVCMIQEIANDTSTTFQIKVLCVDVPNQTTQNHWITGFTPAILSLLLESNIKSSVASTYGVNTSEVRLLSATL